MYVFPVSQDPPSASVKIIGDTRSLVTKRSSTAFPAPDSPHVMVGSVPILLPKIVVKSEVPMEIANTIVKSDVKLEIDSDNGDMVNIAPIVVETAPIVSDRPKIEVTPILKRIFFSREFFYLCHTANRARFSHVLIFDKFNGRVAYPSQPLLQTLHMSHLSSPHQMIHLTIHHVFEPFVVNAGSY